MNEVIAVQKQEVAPVPAVVDPKTPRKSLRKSEAAKKFSGSPGLKAFAEAALGVPDAKIAPVSLDAKQRAKDAKKAAAKPSAKPAPVVAVAPVEKIVFVPRVYTKGQAMFSLDDVSRPVSGRLLLAHTHAALTVLGLIDAKRPVAKKAQLLTLIGQRAVNYHVGKGNLEAAPDHGIRLSVLGWNVFNERMKSGKVDTEAAMLFQSAFLDGKPDTKINVKAGNLYSAVFN